jgi:signal transduction histidine kinase
VVVLEEDPAGGRRRYRRPVTWRRPQRYELLAGAAGGTWAVAFLVPDWRAVAVLAPALAAVAAATRRHPVAAGYGLALAEALQELVGVPVENPASTVAVVLAATALGRHASPAAGALPLTLYVAAVSARDGFAPPTVLFVTLLVCALWGAGRLVARRTARAAAARRAATDLAATDPAARAERLVAEERARLAGETLGVVRAAVEAMQREADAAEPDLAPRALAAIQAHGRRAVAELRRLLGLLRSEPEPPSSPTAAGGRMRARAWPLDVAIAGLLAVVVLAESALAGSPPAAGSVGLSLGLCAALGLRRTLPWLACAAAAVPLVVALATGIAPVNGFEAAVVPVLLAWSVAVDGRLRSSVALLAWLAAALLAVRRLDPGNEAILLALVAAGAVAGHLWAARRSEERAWVAAVDRLWSRHADAAEAAVRGERLRLARELHDVASHAIGVMVLQAGAAEALRERDPAAARSALAAVRAAGGQALAELGVLFGLLDAGAVGAPGLAGTAPAADLAGAVGDLVQRMRTGGLDVGLSVRGDLTGELAGSGTAFRVVQEALTNAARHAPGGRVEVVLARESGRLTVEVRNDEAAAPAPAGSGFGLVGLAERVRAEGGSISAGPDPAGGFTVRARLPLRPRVPSAPARSPGSAP